MKRIILYISIIIGVVVLFGLYQLERVNIKTQIYLEKSQSLKNEIKELIERKQGATSALTYILSKDKNIIESLKTNDIKLVDYKELINGLDNFKDYKDLWIQIVDKNGYCFYRSWTDKIGDSVSQARLDIAKILKNPKPMTNHISTGRFDMTFKTIYPIYYENEFLGVIEMISHFNSISKALKDDNIEPVMIVDESYTDNFIKPFSGLFIGRNYVTNIDASKELMKKIEENGISKFLNITNYLLLEDYIVTTYKVNNIENKPMGFFVMFYKLEDIDIEKLNDFDILFLKRIIIILVFIMFITTFFVNKRFIKNLNDEVLKQTKKLQRQKNKLTNLVEAHDKNVIFSKTDLKGRIIYVSEAFCQISGYSKKELLGKSHNIIRHPEMSKEFFEDLWQNLELRKSIERDIKNLDKNGNYYWVKSKFDPVYNEKGKHVGYSAVRENITSQKEVELLQKEIAETQKEVVFRMGAIGESRSKETGNHVKRVAEYSKLLAIYYGLSEEKSEMLKQASPMHDIGKVGIPDSILNKPGRFDDNEREVMNRHVTIGYDMLKVSNRPLLKMAAIVAYQHHEKWDGTGYPNNLKGEEISICGRITALADVFDALGSDRCYKKAWDDERIFKMFKEEKGKHFEPKLVDIFFEHKEKFIKIRNGLRDV
ncbi:MAG: PAS domain S-box protein [Campylobacterota bacterium]|nr:PAS domain S-box protein [Campylobacterota bacterium]